MGTIPQGFYLYLMSASETGPCKVGVSANPIERLKALRTSCPFKLEFSELWQCDTPELMGVAEKLAHASLKKHRMHGEWFDISPSKAITIITLWMFWTAKVSAAQRGEDPDTIPPPPMQGVGLISNGLFSESGGRP